MKRVQRWIATVVSIMAIALFVSLPASATEVVTQLEGYWVQRNGDLVFYGIAGPCVYNGTTSGIYLIRKTLDNFDQLSDALNIAMAKSYYVDLVVESCDLNQNVVTFAKICKNPAYCQ